MSKFLHIASDSFKDYFINDPQKQIVFWGPIDNINILVGANNSGKSRFLREIIKKEKFTLYEKGNEFEKIALQIEQEFIKVKDKLKEDIYQIELKRPLRKEKYNSNNKSLENLINTASSVTISITQSYLDFLIKNLNQLLIEEKIAEPPIDFFLFLKSLFQFLDDTLEYRFRWQGDWVNISYRGNLIHSCLSDFKNIIPLVDLLIENYKPAKSENVKKIYIPTLRSVNALYSSNAKNHSAILKYFNNDYFENTVLTNYNLATIKDFDVFTGYKLYSEILNSTTSIEEEIRNRHKEFEKFLSETFFNNEQIHLISTNPNDPNITKQQIIIKIGNNPQHEVFNIGDGIQSIILLSYKLFLCSDDSWIFIEEPEIFLHPGLQRIFLNLITNNIYLKNKNLKIFFTTHSNHLLDLAITKNSPLSIFVFEKRNLEDKERFEIKNVFNSDVHILSTIGVNNSSVFLAHSSIWVEGITDKLYLKKILNAYCKKNKLPEFIEDLDFSYFMYGGSNVSNYLFANEEIAKELNLTANENVKAQFLANRIFLLADQDKDKDFKHSFFSSLNSPNFKYKITSGKEIENIIPENVLKVVLTKLSKKITPEMINQIKINKAEYKETGLGEYLKKKLKNKAEIRICAKGGTLTDYYKRKLASLVYDYDNLEELMDSDTEELAKEVYDFIKMHKEHKI